jgi:hypothetical protein
MEQSKRYYCFFLGHGDGDEFWMVKQSENGAQRRANTTLELTGVGGVRSVVAVETVRVGRILEIIQLIG